MSQVDPQKRRELAVRVLRRLREAGFEALWAGGCVRDQLLDRTPNDYDVATSATPAEIRELFGHRHTLAIGAAFGVVAVVGRKPEGTVEVSTFRRDAEYSDGRHPDAVVFSSPEDDAQRRDFTINGLFYDPIEERVIDYVGGLDDIARRLVRAIGDPRARFAEDKLRMIRAVRIAAGFDFRLDEETLAAIREMAATIHVVSPERVAQEMRKMLAHTTRAEALGLLLETRLLAELLPELAALRGATGGEKLWQHTLQVLAGLREADFALALAALVHALGEEPRALGSLPTAEGRAKAIAAAKAICERWRLSNKEHDAATWLLAHHGLLAGAAPQRWSKLQPLLISPDIHELVALHQAEALAVGGDTAARGAVDAAYCREQLARPMEELNPPPLLDGNDLVAHGVPRGEIYRWLLESVRAAQLDGEVTAKREALVLVDRLLDERQA
ncbi:MAG: CCA tRNA nucleotidyltransferase [Planctomycetia bacterium]|nr:CCA tRNA nucleotidyltransferase [Planctomycetia bacterium]